jgi:zinc D-Ala-D-Ala carboxypeptidase
VLTGEVLLVVGRSVVGSHRAGSALREAALSQGSSRTHRGTRLAGRAAVLVSLLAATVVVPVTQGALANGLSVNAIINPAELPTTVSALTAVSGDAQLPASLQAAGLVDREGEEASRNFSRDGLLPGCDGHKPTKLSPNGQLPQSDLCTLWDGHTQVRADYAMALAGLNEDFVAKFGVDLCMVSGYRTLAEQRAVKAKKGYLAATPGKSNHGLGLAVDFCTDQLTTARYNWLRTNGPRWGIDNPEWARTTKIERWHWEFTAAVESDNSYTGATSQGT